jgi:hypothetical protein
MDMCLGHHQPACCSDVQLCVRALIAACTFVAQLGYDFRMGNR